MINNDRAITIKIKRKYHINYYPLKIQKSFGFFYLVKIVIFLIIYVPLMICFKYKLRKINSLFYMRVVYKGLGEKNLFDTKNVKLPTEVFINGISQSISQNNIYNLTQEMNNVILGWNFPLTLLDEMFINMDYVIEVDFSNFDCSNLVSLNSIFFSCISLERVNFENCDTSKVVDVSYMFSECYSLTSLDLHNFNTSSVTFMDYMFSGCKNLVYLNLDNFNTSNTYSMKYMFYDCRSLTSLNLLHFNTLHVISMNGMFSYCENLSDLKIYNFNTTALSYLENMFINCCSLTSLNIYNFNISDTIIQENLFSKCTSNEIILCINEKTSQKILDHLKDRKINYKNICNCTEKIILEKEKCISSCLEDENYLYEYNNICYRECPQGTYLLSGSDYKCDIDPEGYYLDSNSKYDSPIYKLCYQACKKCNKEGNANEHNCIECKDNYEFKTDLLNKTRCYEKCEFYYYFDLDNHHHCTKEKICPEEQNKLINEENICVDKCSNNNLYQYEYNNNCYKACPKGTVSDNYICLNTSDTENNIDKRCFETCKECFELGDENDNKCLECISGYSFKTNKYNISNCYEICENYYYFDSLNNHFCTENRTCPKEYKYFILENNQCVEDCINDTRYIYEYNNICYEECPSNTYIPINNSLLYTNNKCIEKFNISNFFEKISSITDNLVNFENNSLILNEIKNKLLDENFDSLLEFIDREKKDIFIQEDNLVIQLTSSNNQNNNEYDNISTIHLGECEYFLKQNYELNNTQSLLIFKVDIFEEGLLIPTIEYEVYNPKNKEQLNLTFCKDAKINISIPVKINEDNLFKYNLSSEYYNDICYIYKTEKGTDIILGDRRNEYYSNNMSLCENQCSYEGYNSNNKKVLCKCKVKLNLSFMSNIKINQNKLLNNFIDFKNSLNLGIMKCYSTLFTRNGLIHNIGSYIILSIIIINILSGIFFKYKGFYLFKIRIHKVVMNIRKCGVNIFSPYKSKTKIYKGKKFTKKIGNKKFKNKSSEKINFHHSYNPPKTKSKILKKRNVSNHINDNCISLKTNTILSLLNKSINNYNNKNKNYLNYNEYELNTLIYHKALVMDKRTYFQYYFSLLRQKHSIIFSFCCFTFKIFLSDKAKNLNIEFITIEIRVEYTI